MIKANETQTGKLKDVLFSHNAHLDHYDGWNYLGHSREANSAPCDVYIKLDDVSKPIVSSDPSNHPMISIVCSNDDSDYISPDLSSVMRHRYGDAGHLILRYLRCHNEGFQIPIKVTKYRYRQQMLKAVRLFDPQSNSYQSCLYDKENCWIIGFEEKTPYFPSCNAQEVIDGGGLVNEITYGFECWHSHDDVYRLGPKPI